MSNDAQTVLRMHWKPVVPLEDYEILINGTFAALDALRLEWERRISELPEHEQTLVRQRSLRRLSIETGILERLYEVDWGLTLTLVAEGFTRDVVERSGGKVDDRTLATLRAQMDSLAMVLEFVRSDRSLSPSFIKELHQAITRTQDYYTVTDSLGRVVDTYLPKGEWKKQPNHVMRQDNTLLEYTPPEHVASEIDRLVELWNALEKQNSKIHPMIKAAWLHHSFVKIHPFADGNGRVARALTLLVIEKYHYAPLVVDRWHRIDYLRALDAANDGKLTDLMRLFVKLEGAALTSELEKPQEVIPVTGVALDVAHTLAAQLAEARRRHETGIQQRLHAYGVAVGGRMRAWFENKKVELQNVFRGQGLNDIHVSTDNEIPPARDRLNWFRWQINESAHTAGHFADFSFFTGWCRLIIRTDGWQLRYIASLHGAGKEPGVMAVTTFAEIAPFPVPQQSAADHEAVQEYVRTTKDAFHFVHSESLDDINQRGVELESLLDEGLAVALMEFLKKT